ncbi:MAG: cell division initiation protein [Thermosediminibacterales bacterium]|nr:cell division initiation protein [Thermosediminibacterales bacterium]MDK2836081.1 cell division initiation protein [Thermosediminibacterales bacterium]
MDTYMFTPIDIKKIEFKKSFRGYNIEEVDEFMEKIKKDYEKLYEQNIRFKEEISELKDKIENYKNIEETLQNALILAQQTAEEVKNNAYKEKEIILREAHENAKKIIQTANLKVVDMQREYEEIKKDFLVFKTRFINFLKSQLELIETQELHEGISTDQLKEEISNGNS